jgi:hypothetical protein
MIKYLRRDGKFNIATGVFDIQAQNAIDAKWKFLKTDFNLKLVKLII